MSDPLKLPPNPSNADLAHGLEQTHECLEAARDEIRQNTNALEVLQGQNAQLMPAFVLFIKWTGRMQRFGVYIISTLIVAYITVLVQNQVNHNNVAAQAQNAAVQAKAAGIVAAQGQQKVSQQLKSLGAAP